MERFCFLLFRDLPISDQRLFPSLQTFQSELISHQADLRFLDLTAQRYVTEANSYKKRLMAFKAECQGTRSSLILEEEHYAVKEEVTSAKYRFHELLSECNLQVST